MSKIQTRSPLGRALGRGSARDGVEHWWSERISAVALAPLMALFVVWIVIHAGDDYTAFIAWLKTPAATSLMTLLLISLFYHTALGLQVVIEDYVHSQAKFPLLVGMRLGCFGLAVIGVIATLRIAFGA
jgi:succinate dehydrogenase / fumarate reductase membrane anchor subunit